MPVIRGLTIACLMLFYSTYLSSAETIIYQYDDLNRLIRIEQPDGGSIDYDYDSVGNRIIREVTPRSSCPGDIKGDGDIDGADLAMLLADLEAGCSGNCRGDLDGSGLVDVADVILFTEYFGRFNCR